MGINYSIQLTFMECLLWACCWVKLVNISWTRLIFREMKYWLLKKKRKKYWLLLFVLSVIFPFNVYWMDTIARIIQIFNTFVCVCVCVCVRTRACIPLHLVLLLLHWLSVASSVAFTCLSLVFVTSNFISYSIQHIPSPGMHMNSVSLHSDSSFLFCAFS